MDLYLSSLNEIWGDPICSYKPNLDVPIGHVCTDSRHVVQGSFFVPLQGKNFNGHDFIEQAFFSGAKATVIASDCNSEVPEDFLHWIVEDTLKAYQQLALLHRRHLNFPLVAITGSAGKTTTRELLRSSLASLGPVLASTGNNNNEIGVPLTLLGGDSSHRVAIIEMGMRSLGEIKCLSRCSEPDIAVITNIGSAHLGRLGSRYQIAKAKCEITSYLNPKGVVVIPAGNSLLEEVLSQNWNGRIVRVMAQDKSSNNFENFLPSADLLGKVDLNKNFLEVEGKAFQLPLEGLHNTKNLMLALAVAKELNVPWENLNKLSVELPAGHQRCLKLGSLTVLDETYNSSPEAVQAALELLVSKPGRHFAVLGTMLELGQESTDLHRAVGENIVRLGLDGLVVVADEPEASAIANAAASLPLLAVVARPEQAIKPLLSWLRPGDILLLKASRGIQLERLLPLLPRDI